MEYQQARACLLQLPDALEDFPFGLEVAVFKVRGKVFATLTSVAGTTYCNLKCDPDEALALRDIFPAVQPGYHMNKKHWNTVTLDGSIPVGEIKRMMDNSWQLVVNKLPRHQRPLLTPQR